VIFNDCRIYVLNCLMMVPMLPKHVAYENTFLLCRRFLANYLYTCNTQRDAHYEANEMVFIYVHICELINSVEVSLI
jgi:hypothetical protein